MKYLKYLLAFFVLQLSAQDQLRFINGDKWFGELQQFNNEKIDSWKFIRKNTNDYNSAIKRIEKWNFKIVKLRIYLII